MGMLVLYTGIYVLAYRNAFLYYSGTRLRDTAQTAERSRHSGKSVKSNVRYQDNTEDHASAGEGSFQAGPLAAKPCPRPATGINDVLIRVHKTGICGTDLHIYKWDAWAQKTIPVPMVVGHEFVGEVVEIGSNVNDFHPGDIVSAEGHVVCGRCRNCLAGRRHLVRGHQGHRRESRRRVRRIHFRPDDQRLASPADIDREVALHLRPVRQRRSHRALVRCAGRGRADHGRRSHRHHGRGQS